MCFSNLPIEFDDDGNPYLAEEAEDVDTPGDVDGSPSDGDGTSGCECDAGTSEVTLAEADPEATFEAIVDSMPGDVREQVAGTNEARTLDESLEASPDDRVGERDEDRDGERDAERDGDPGERDGGRDRQETAEGD